MDKHLESIRKQIKTARKAKGMIQEELAEKVGLSRTSIYQIERGNTKPTLENFIKICDALGLEIQLKQGKELKP